MLNYWNYSYFTARFLTRVLLSHASITSRKVNIPGLKATASVQIRPVIETTSELVR